MAIIDGPAYCQATNQTITGDALTALTAWCSAVDAAIKRAVAPFYPEPTTISGALIDAPLSNVLQLPVTPVRSITSLYLRWGSNGDSSSFTSDDLLTNYDDYYLPLDDRLNGYSKSGHVYRRGASTWGYETRYVYNRLAPTPEPNRGAVLATWTAGPTSVPDDIFAAAVLMTSLLYNRKTTGLPTTSESWNGYSYSTAAPFLVSALASPDVTGLLSAYLSVRVA